MTWSSEAIKKGIKPVDNMTPEEFAEWRNSLDPDSMGFDGVEAIDDEL